MRTQTKGKEHKFCPREPRARIDANLRRLDSAGFCRSPASLRLTNRVGECSSWDAGRKVRMPRRRVRDPANAHSR